MNVVMNNGGGFIEVQGTAEGHAFRRHELDALLESRGRRNRATLRAADRGARGRLTRSPHVRRPDASCSPAAIPASCANSRVAGARAGSTLVAPVRPWTSSRRRKPASPFSTTRSSRRAMPRGVTGLPAIADDSGIEVDALGGAPGVHSARYAGEDASDDGQSRKLLNALEGAARRASAPRAIAASSCYVRERRRSASADRRRHLGRSDHRRTARRGRIRLRPDSSCRAARRAPSRRCPQTRSIALSHRGAGAARASCAQFARAVTP